MYVVQAQDLVLVVIDTIGARSLTLLSVGQGMITVQYALLHLEAFVDEVNTEVAGTEVQIGTSVVDHGLRTIEVGDIGAGALG